MPTLVIALSDILLDPKNPIDLSKIPSSEALQIIKQSYGFLSDAVEVSIENGIATIIVDEKALAYKLGLRADDKIIAIDDVIPEDIEHFKWLLKQKRNSRALVTILRDNQQKVLKVDVQSDLSE